MLNDDAVWVWLREHDGMSTGDIAKGLGLSKAYLAYDMLSRLKTAHRVRRERNGRHVSWFTISPELPPLAKALGYKLVEPKGGRIIRNGIF